MGQKYKILKEDIPQWTIIIRNGFPKRYCRMSRLDRTRNEKKTWRKQKQVWKKEFSIDNSDGLDTEKEWQDMDSLDEKNNAIREGEVGNRLVLRPKELETWIGKRVKTKINSDVFTHGYIKSYVNTCLLIIMSLCFAGVIFEVCLEY